MLQTTNDIFFLVLSICVGAFTVFLCWWLFYMIRFFKQTTDTFNAIKDKIERIASVFHFLRNKLVSEGMNTIVNYIKEKKQNNETAKHQKNNKTKNQENNESSNDDKE
ncbi:MAG: hypothetical protein V1928_02355 [Parcubacteria group bacterium]